MVSLESSLSACARPRKWRERVSARALILPLCRQDLVIVFSVLKTCSLYRDYSFAYNDGNKVHSFRGSFKIRLLPFAPVPNSLALKFVFSKN